MHGVVRNAVVLGLALCLLTGGETIAADEHGQPLRSGAFELGMGGSVTSAEGATTAMFRLQAGTFRSAGTALIEYGGGVSYSTVSDLDILDFEATVGALWRLDDSSTWALINVTGAVRQEWVGSFSQVRYPVGFGAGFKVLASHRAAGTLTYEYRRILDDPVRAINEHRVVVGLSILFRNE